MRACRGKQPFRQALLHHAASHARLLAALAGHSSIQATQRYIDLNPDQLSAAVELL
jgi:hypothetical protein